MTGRATLKVTPMTMGNRVIWMGEAIYRQRVAIIRYLSIDIAVKRTRDIDFPLESMAAWSLQS